MRDGIREQLSNGLYCNIDWLSFTFDVAFTLQDVLDFFGWSSLDFQHFDKGASGYRKRIRHVQASVSVLFDGNADMGVHIDCSGTAITFLLTSYKFRRMSSTPFQGDAMEVIDFDISIMVQMLKELWNHVHFTRLDLAVDDVGTRFYSLKKLSAINKALDYICRCKNWQEIVDNDTSSGSITGYTIYLGKRVSDIFMRIYDKQLEQNDKRLKAGLPLLEDSWVRWELELKRENCNNAVKMLCDGVPLTDLTIGILSNYLRIIVRDNDRKSRCSSAPLWIRFLNGIKKARIAKHKQDLEIDQKKDWLMRQCSRSLATVTAADGGSIDFIECMLAEGSLKQSLHDETLISDYLENSGLSPWSESECAS